MAFLDAADDEEVNFAITHPRSYDTRLATFPRMFRGRYCIDKFLDAITETAKTCLAVMR